MSTHNSMKTLLLSMQNLEGVRGGKRKGEWAKSAHAVFAVLKRNHVATDAGDHGALNVYRNDAGQYHCEFMRHYFSLSKKLFTSQAKVRAWLKKWRPELN